MSSVQLAGYNLDDSFLYFAYGSNLLTNRILVNNPSAKNVGIGKLEDYSLAFLCYSQRWHGAVATIIENEGSHVWGVLWALKNEDMDSLDEQESVHIGFYKPISIKIEMEDGSTVKARSYQIIRKPDPDQRPSKVYLNVILSGAHENNLPEEYIRYLEQIEHNGYVEDVDYSNRQPN